MYVYLCILTPSYQHFKAFPVSKFNSNTSFLYQLFKGNSNFIFVKPCKVISLSIFSSVHLLFMNICMYVCMYVCICIHTYHLYYKSCVRCMSSVGTAARRANRARSARGDFAMQSVASHNGTAARSVNRARSARGDFWRHLCAV